MDDGLFERLLYEEESTTLDFKKEQYPFVKVGDEERSELLKDILGFANAWRRSEAYILIGVEDVRGGQGNVIGIQAAEHLDDHSLQQFVNNLTNRPVRFHYEAFGLDGNQIGIIRIEHQPRPIYLKKDYGKLKKNEVYVRRGSSTDPTKPAGPDEIAQMGASLAAPSAELLVEFAGVTRDDSLGTTITCDTEYCEMPSFDSIPDLASPSYRVPGLGIDLSLSSLDPSHRVNEDFYREMADYEFARRIYHPVRLVVKNIGSVAANSVRVELTIANEVGAMIIDASDLPDLPRRRAELLSRSAFTSVGPALRRTPGEVAIDKNDERFRIAIECGHLQPGRRVWSDVFYMGKKATGDLTLNGQVFAENLPQPREVALMIALNVAQTRMSVDTLIELPRHGRR